ncbi:uncharacterized protein LOC109797824 [Cajanus cajan]|nr:uncharacterized protein LOC109797813 [Cajanus cajan]XP_020213555.1 uncharacterized protein LOC109797824 [Cajanus cajan]
MDKNKNNSNYSICRKIRQALTSNPAIQAVQRISSFNQKPEPVTKRPNSPPPNTNISIKNKPPPHHKARKEESGAIPVSAAKAASSGRPITRQPHPQHVPMQGKQHQHGHVVVQAEPQGKKQMDINEHFKVFIENTREKMMRSMTNIGWAQSNHPAPAPDQEVHGSNKNESHYSDFIQRVRKKLRATTAVRKSGSLKEN